MNETNHAPGCEHAEDLVAVLYGEASESQRRDFELHTQHCSSCRAEFAAFAEVRESLGEWRDEALTGFVAAHAAPGQMKKSALAALRQFFDLSPLWLKGAVGFAGVVFCALLVLAVVRLQPADEPVRMVEGTPGAVFTQQDVDHAVQEALAKQTQQQRAADPKPVIIVEKPRVRTANVARAEPKARRPFSKAERDQLAAELRLISSDDEIDLEPLEDRR